nr:Ricin and poly(3-hydroxybutyrate) depolymerase fusion [Myxococcota bacterium]
ATGSGGSGASGGGSSTGAGGQKATMGCGSAKAPMSGRFDIDVDGTTREYILDVPDDYDASHPYRLIFGWHPLGGSAEQVAKGGYYGLEREANGSAIFVSAEGLPFQGNNLGWANSNGRDLKFLEAMMTRFRAELCIDENRIFSTGFSFGGMMSFAVGCGSGIMRAIAPQAGNIQVAGCEDGTQPVAVMGFHGDDDTVVAIDGGRAGRDVFVERNQCSDQTMPVSPSWCDGLNSSNQPCNCVSYQGCMPGYPVTWCEFNGPHTPAPNSGATIWNFFSQF